MERAKIRLFVEQPLGQGNSVPMTQPQANYLFNVMRLGVGDVVALFNGQDGEWTARVVDAAKRRGMVVCEQQTLPLQTPPDLWLLFAPIKKARTDFIVEKAAEMGAAKVFPVQTDYTNSDRIRQDKLQAHAIEAAEQCGGTYVPEVANIKKLSAMLDAWPEDRHLLFCDESMVGEPSRLQDLPQGPWAIVIGPEGGFSDRERDALRSHPNSHPISLGPRILRADTAAVAALALWQSALGDWA
ncbi:16S rRNA (uracil(1498)-N(3))-methyltransferase [Litoreibacter arenae]|uniref:Ribosomal RNA small subunit methyltransferase E n=1 Tax=Litoreibacter arenae DSM 19593 TaxID=1123360 RepID=S9QQ66_9RHOB|nr:16S rRNA (uracil(1498)-N(3))-methyltransferase [Litoreibacter arenae]EPX81792.1 Ribosomal RNA small subunit methyltransferase E [Litoreibacter arenae DSM 19593]